MHRSTSVQPCMHSFCSSCLGGWLKRPGDRIPRCPICRQGVAGVGKNHALDSMIEGLLKVHPDRQRSIAAISDLDSRDPLHDCGYDLVKLRGPGDVAAGFARVVVAAAAAAEGMDADDGSDSEHDGGSYSDDENEEEARPWHAWTAPGAVRPPCVNCGTPAWQPLRAAVDRCVSAPVPAAALMKSALASNSFEQEILQEWLHSKGLSLQQADRVCITNSSLLVRAYACICIYLHLSTLQS
ncbi:CHFR [Symbiodinium pilosum]|uniref:CHFR protein n=1 Tax=Symbiodinium pilosum TaxID=2952 RepID=A0A812WYB4_SYMPI|nr:CHFR [Symbiodinium pilosum]